MDRSGGEGRIMHNRYLILSSSLLVPALYCQIDHQESALLTLKGDPLILKALFADGVIEERGEDEDLRPRYVDTKNAFEQFFGHALVAGTLKRVIAVLHTGDVTPDNICALLQQNGTVMVAYPALEKYPENLFDIPLGCLEIAKEMVGATYLLEAESGEWRTFSIRFTQAQETSHPAHAAMWLGGVENGPAAERLAQVSAYLQACQGPDLLSFISK